MQVIYKGGKSFTQATSGTSWDFCDYYKRQFKWLRNHWRFLEKSTETTGDDDVTE